MASNTPPPTVVASASIQFADEKNSNIHASIEVVRKTSNPDKPYVSNSKFAPGETPHLLLFLSKGCTLKKSYFAPSNVTITAAGKYVTDSKKEALKYQTLPDSTDKSYNDASVSLPVSVLNTTETYGDIGSLTLQEDQKTFRAERLGVGVGLIDYRAEAQVYQVNVPPMTGKTEFEVVIVLVVEGPKA